MPMILPDADMMLRIALLVWYITLGSVIGVFGVWKVFTIFNIKMSPCFRGICIGAWMNFVIALLMYDTLSTLMIGSIMEGWYLFWIVLEGAFFGLVVDGITTKMYGDGKKLL